ncbi:MAG: DUF6159 family protein [Euryarchaeota archaeon]|nr:DUF6159 family protein [Euryarchaeota archaeon]
MFLSPFYLVSYLTFIFFNVAIVACAMKRMDGGDPAVGHGLNFAAGRMKAIFQLAMVAATVGPILNAISNRSGVAGKIVTGFIGAARSIATYFVLPIMAFENIGPFQAIEGSLWMFKRTWGESLPSNLGMGSIFFAPALLGIVPMVLAAMFGGITGMVIALVAVIVYWVFLAVLHSTASTVLMTALYRYATTGKVSEEFPAGVIKNPMTAGQIVWK